MKQREVSHTDTTRDVDREGWADRDEVRFKCQVLGCGEALEGPYYFGRAYEAPPEFTWSGVFMGATGEAGCVETLARGSNVLRDPGFESGGVLIVQGQGTGNPTQVNAWDPVSPIALPAQTWFEIEYDPSERWGVVGTSPDAGSKHARYDGTEFQQWLAALGCINCTTGRPYSAVVAPGDVVNFSYRGKREIDNASLMMRLTCHSATDEFLVHDWSMRIINSTYTDSGTLSLTIPANGRYVTAMVLAGTGVTDVDSVVLEIQGPPAEPEAAPSTAPSIAPSIPPLLTVGVDSWIQDEQGMYVGAFLWFKTRTAGVPAVEFEPPPEPGPAHPCGPQRLRDPSFELSTGLKKSTINPPFLVGQHDASWYEHPWTVVENFAAQATLSSANPRTGSRNLHAFAQDVGSGGSVHAYASGNFADIDPGDMASANRPMSARCAPNQRVEWSGWIKRISGTNANPRVDFNMNFLRADGVILSSAISSNTIEGDYEHTILVRHSPANTKYVSVNVFVASAVSGGGGNSTMVLDDCELRVCNPL